MTTTDIRTRAEQLEDIIKEWREKQRLALIEPTTSQIFRAGALGSCADQLESHAAAERQFREKLEALRDALSEMIETHPLLGGLNTFQRKVFLEWTAKLTALLDGR